MIVITLTKVPNSLRGDLTKWYQEIQTGIYVGNVSAKIRDELWERIIRDIGNGQATMAYNVNNEFGYTFRTTRSDRQVVDYDGVPLMKHVFTPTKAVKHGFSNAAKFHKARVMTRKTVQKSNKSKSHINQSIVAIDIETTGLDVAKDYIISIGAVKKDRCFYTLIKSDVGIPKKISDLTGLTTEMLSYNGMDLKTSLIQLKKFIGDSAIVGYNVRFDETFLERELQAMQIPGLSNKVIDLMPVVKKANKFLDNYRLNTVLEDYNILNQQQHHAGSDAQATFELATQLIKNRDFHI